MIAVEGKTQGTETIGAEAFEPAGLTTTVSLQQKSTIRVVHKKRDEDQRIRTDPDVAEQERGDREEKAQNFENGLAVPERKVKPATVDPGVSAARRSELARDLLAMADRLITVCGDVSLATHVQSLKRLLSKCHDELQGHPSESDFMSIVTLVESSLAQCNWKQYTPERLAALRDAFATGYNQPRITFADYERVRGTFRTEKIETLPSFDLESLDTEVNQSDED